MGLSRTLLACLLALFFTAESRGSFISFNGSPATVKNGLTRTVRLTCALNDSAASAGVIGRRHVSRDQSPDQLRDQSISKQVEPSNGPRRDIPEVEETPYNIAEVLSIIVTQNNSDVAVVTHVDPAKVKDVTSNNIHASGSVQNSASSQGSLDITFENPTAEQLDNLECKVASLDQSGHTVVFSQAFEFQVIEPSIMDIITHVASLEKERDIANGEIQQLKNDNTNMKATIAAAKAEIQELKHIETGRLCEAYQAVHLNGTGDRRDATFPVHFKKAYTKPPRVVFGTVQLDVYKEYNLRYTVTGESITNDGFVTRIHLWSDTRIVSLCVDWVSFPQD